MEPPEIKVIEIPVILTTVEGTRQDDHGTWTKFACFSDSLLLGRAYRIGQSVQITIVEAGYEDYKARIARQSRGHGR